MRWREEISKICKLGRIVGILLLFYISKIRGRDSEKLARQ